MKISGSCLCGSIAFEAEHQGARVVACHCGQCRKQSGHLWAATAVPTASLRFDKDSTLAWFTSSQTAERGFCTTCGSSLFWRFKGGENTSVGLGALDEPTNLTLQTHIFTAHKGDYYDITDGLPHEENT